MSAASTEEEQSQDSGRKRFLNIWVPVAVMLVVFVCLFVFFLKMKNFPLLAG